MRFAAFSSSSNLIAYAFRLGMCSCTVGGSMHVSVMRHQSVALENLPNHAQRELSRACDALPLMVTTLTVALLHLHVCMLHALRAVAINAAMRLHPCREEPYNEVHVRSRIRCCSNIQKS
jgi:hypothetical protein